MVAPRAIVTEIVAEMITCERRAYCHAPAIVAMTASLPPLPPPAHRAELRRAARASPPSHRGGGNARIPLSGVHPRSSTPEQRADLRRLAAGAVRPA